MSTITLQLQAAEVAEIMKPAVGQGGHQSLMRVLQAKVDKKSGVIELNDSEVGRIIRYSGYGQGGFQNRYRGAFGRALREWME